MSIKDQQTQFNNFANQIQKDLKKYKQMYNSQMSELEKSVKDLNPEQQKVWTERQEAIKIHTKNQNTKGLLSLLDEIKSEIG